MAALNVLFPTLGDTGAAASNTSRIQALLTAGGDVELIGSGVCSINDTLVIGSKTRLKVDPRMTIKTVAGTNKPLLVTNGYSLRATTTAVTLTWSSGATVSVAWTAHGLAVGQYVWLSGSATSHYNGIFQIISVTDANNFVVGLMRVPAGSPTGSAVARLADTKIGIEGGIWDYDNPNNAATGTTNAMLMQLGGVQGLTVRNVTLQKAEKFALCIGAARDVVVDGVTLPTTVSDGVKGYGPLFNARFRNLSGIVGDDGISLQTKEAVAFAYAGWTSGDVINCSIDGVHVTQSTGGAGIAVLYPSVSEYMGGISIKNIGGSTYAKAVAIIGAYASSLVDNVVIENVNAACAVLCNITAASSMSLIATNIELRGLTFHPRSLASANVIEVQSSATVKRLTIADFVVETALWPTSSGYFALLAGPVNDLTIADGVFSGTGGAAGRLLSLAAASAPKVVNIERVKASGGDNFVVIAASMAATFNLNIRGCEIAQTAVVNTSSSVDLLLAGNQITGATNGVLRTASTPTVNFFAQGNKLVSGSWIVVPSGTPVINPKSSEIQVDVSALTGLTKAQGNQCWNTNAAVGTLGVAGPVISDASVWKLQTDLSKTS